MACGRGQHYSKICYHIYARSCEEGLVRNYVSKEDAHGEVIQFCRSESNFSPYPTDGETKIQRQIGHFFRGNRSILEI